MGGVSCDTSTKRVLAVFQALCSMLTHISSSSPTRRVLLLFPFHQRGGWDMPEVTQQAGQSQDPILTQTLNHQASPGGSRSPSP